MNISLFNATLTPHLCLSLLAICITAFHCRAMPTPDDRIIIPIYTQKIKPSYTLCILLLASHAALYELFLFPDDYRLILRQAKSDAYVTLLHLDRIVKPAPCWLVNQTNSISSEKQLNAPNASELNRQWTPAYDTVIVQKLSPTSIPYRPPHPESNCFFGRFGTFGTYSNGRSRISPLNNSLDLTSCPANHLQFLPLSKIIG